VVRHCLAVHGGGSAYRTRFPTHSSIDEQTSTWPNYLLILDNADDLTLARDFLPPTVGGQVLLTTRA
jgi:hypothetical protein